MDFIEELKWRGMLHDLVPGVEEILKNETAAGYAGFDPTAPSLQVGNLAVIMLLLHFQKAGHKPVALVGGATGLIGDPSGKREERQLLSREQVKHNIGCFKDQLTSFLDFDCGEKSAEIVDNYDWFGKMKLLEFLREAGKHLTVNYMSAKDSVKQRLEKGLSFTEFSYQLLQAYDFYKLNKESNCKIQLGGSDQWGNITSGTELVRRKSGNEVYGITCPLITRADGTKFGKSAGGESIWLDPGMTSPYRFYQYWLNVSDTDASRYIRIFSLFDKEYIEGLEKNHKDAPHERLLQKTLAEDVTVRVHSKQEYEKAVKASSILFSKKSTKEELHSLDEKIFLDVFQGVPRFGVSKTAIEDGLDVISLLAEKCEFFKSKGEARRLIKANGLSINKEKIQSQENTIDSSDMIKGKYLLVQKGKKDYALVEAV